ncbi:MAG: phosphoenolpyruvate carboxykinase (ATP) [Anaerolineaceae bacterium]|nr:phosphoenolpyruvate carboxykinase (ATP) [Anaerolineaceae bacterium]
MPLPTVVHPRSSVGLNEIGIETFEGYNLVHWNLNPSEIYEYALKLGEAHLTDNGALRVLTGQYTGRSPKDKFFVEEPSSKDRIWWGNINQPVSQELFDHMLDRARFHLEQQQHIFVQDLFVGADPTYRMPIRVISEAAYHAIFSWNMFIRPTVEELNVHQPEWTVVAAPSLVARPYEDGTRTGTFIGVDIAKKTIVIVGTRYSGEVKKGIFSVMNYMLPQKGVLPMHCSANMGPDGDTAVFFGLSGTGKTTLSADQSRTLIGDDEHGWSDNGVFNFEGGCYAKVINIDPDSEPEIYATTQMFGTILENVRLTHDTRSPDFSSSRFTENTRASYPINYIPNASETGIGGHPKNIIFLTADAFGVLPPISKLSAAQAQYHFISGYTAKVAGTERGVTEPTATFSACFGAPFMPLHPTVYAKLLAEKIEAHGSDVWLINTGWNGRGERMPLKYTRRMVNAALNGELNDVEFVEEPYFGLSIPKHVPGVPDEVLDPVRSWESAEAYANKAMDLAERFVRNFEQFADQADEDVLAAGPKVGDVVR